MIYRFRYSDIKRVCISFLILFSMISCTQGDDGDDSTIDYYSRSIDYKTEIELQNDPSATIGEISVEKIITRIYNSDGVEVAVYKHQNTKTKTDEIPFLAEVSISSGASMNIPAGSEYYVDRSDVYEVDEEKGFETLVETYYYYYELVQANIFIEEDADGNEVYELQDYYRILAGITTDTEGIWHQMYLVDYSAATVDFPDNYSYICDFINSSSSSTPVAVKQSSWQKVLYNDFGDYLLEQFFLYNTDGSGSDKALVSESVSWYDSVSGQYTHELYHRIRKKSGEETGDTGGDAGDDEDEVWFYTSWSWDQEGRAFMAVDYDYYAAGNPDSVPVLPSLLITGLEGAASGTQLPIASDVDSIPYLTFSTTAKVEALEISHPHIGSQFNMNLYHFDSTGNKIQDTNYSYGRIQTISNYLYDSFGTQIEEARYINGGLKLDHKITTRFDSALVGEVQFEIEDVLSYRYGDSISQGEAPNKDDSDSRGLLPGEASMAPKKGIRRPVQKRFNHTGR